MPRRKPSKSARARTLAAQGMAHEAIAAEVRIPLNAVLRALTRRDRAEAAGRPRIHAPGSVRVHAQLPADLHERAQAKADAQQISIAQGVLDAVRAWVG